MNNLTQNWNDYSLEEIATRDRNAIVDGPFGSNLKISDYVDEGVPVLQGNNITGNKFRFSNIRYITKNKADELSRSKVVVGDLLIVKIGSVGYSAIVDDLGDYDSAIIPANLLKVSLDEKKVDSKYVFHYLTSGMGVSLLRSIASSTAQPAISLSKVKKIKIPIPNLLTQARIASILDAVDNQIEKTNQIIQKTEGLKNGLMNDLYTKGIGHSKFKSTKLGMIPTEWKTCLLDEVAKRGTGHTPSKKFPNYWNGGVKWVSLSDTYRLDRVYISETEKEISQEGIDHSSAVLHPAGVVVLSRDAGVGKSAITTEPMAVSQHFISWECGTDLHNLYLYYLLQHWKPIFENIATGSTIKTIGMPFFKNLEIPLPPVNEQKEIAQILYSLDLKLAKEKSYRDRLLILKNGLMNDIFSRKVEVN